MKQYGVRAMLCCVGLLAGASAGCADVQANELGAEDGTIAGTSQALTAAGFSMLDAYYGDSFGSCSSSAKKDIVGYEPSEPGVYPLFIYVTGTTMSFQGPEALKITSEMASRGFVAATIEYNNGSYPTCGTMRTRASCIFNASSANSAVAKLCARAKADCSRGIVVSGFSQGANLAALSKNYDARVKGAYLLGHGNQASLINVASCADDGATTLLPSEMRSINGDSDQYFGNTLSGTRSQLQAVTGVTCSTSSTCIQAAGHGWHILSGSNVTDGRADHCYFLSGANSTCSTYSGLDANWVNGTSPWSLTPNLTWLAARVGM